METDYSIPGLRIVKYSNPEQWDIIVTSANKIGGWNKYSLEKSAVDEIPPTYIVYKNEYYIIIEEKETSKGWEYKMIFAPEHSAQHHVVYLSPEKFIAEKKEKEEFEKFDKQVKIACAYDFLLGWLPVRIQEKLSDKLGFGVADACRRNAAFQYITSLAISIFGIIYMCAGFRSGGGIGAFLVALVFFLLAVEGMLRKIQAEHGENPHGFYLFEIIDYLYIKVLNKEK